MPFLSRRGRTGEWWSSLFGSTGEGNTRRYLDLMMGCWCFAVGTLGGYLEGGGFEELYLAVEAVGRAVPGRWRHRQDKKESRQNEMQLLLRVGVVCDCAWFLVRRMRLGLRSHTGASQLWAKSKAWVERPTAPASQCQEMEVGLTSPPTQKLGPGLAVKAAGNALQWELPASSSNDSAAQPSPLQHHHRPTSNSSPPDPIDTSTPSPSPHHQRPQ